MPEAGKPEESKSKENSANKPEESKSKVNSADLEDFEWLLYQDPGEQRSKFATAMLENPFAPLGALATVIALAGGLYNLQKNNSARQQFFMRARVGAQGFTIASVIGGIIYHSHMREAENQEKLKNKNKQN